MGLEILINEPTLARNRSISSRGTQICPNVRRPRSGRLIFSHIQVPLELIDRFLAKVGSLIKISSPNVSRFGQLAKNRLGLGLRYPIFSGAYGGGIVHVHAHAVSKTLQDPLFCRCPEHMHSHDPLPLTCAQGSKRKLRHVFMLRSESMPSRSIVMLLWV